jgi:dihydrofolate reductase
MTSHEWQTSVFLSGDIAEKVAKLKQEQGPDLHVWGSGNLLQTLIKHDLVDVFWLMIYPITLGAGKRLFADGTIPAAFKVTERITSVQAQYEQFQHAQSTYRKNDLRLNLSAVSRKDREEGQNQSRIASGHKVVNKLRS